MYQSPKSPAARVASRRITTKPTDSKSSNKICYWLRCFIAGSNKFSVCEGFAYTESDMCPSHGEAIMQKGKSDVVPLASALSARMSVQGSSVTATAKELGISASYLSQLLAGDKAFGAADDEILRSAATYLKLPPVVCFLLAGRLRHTDFIDPIDHEAELNNALQVIATSSYALEAATDIKTLSSLPSSVKLLLILTYEAAGNCNLISKKKRWPWTAEPLVSEISQLLR